MQSDCADEEHTGHDPEALADRRQPFVVDGVVDDAIEDERGPELSRSRNTEQHERGHRAGAADAEHPVLGVVVDVTLSMASDDATVAPISSSAGTPVTQT